MSKSTDSDCKNQYTIYELINPIRHETFYVGCTTQPQMRLYHHVDDARNKGKDDWSTSTYETIKSLLVFGYQPMMRELDTIICEDQRFALRLEQLWITQKLYEGCPLVNEKNVIPSAWPRYAHIAFVKQYANKTWAIYNRAEAAQQFQLARLERDSLTTAIVKVAA